MRGEKQFIYLFYFVLFYLFLICEGKRTDSIPVLIIFYTLALKPDVGFVAGIE